MRKPKCIYCLRDSGSTSFNHREHVMPRFMGRFKGQNPVIQGDIVCDKCNNKVFNRLETNFAEDSYEGITGKMLNLDGSGSVRMKGKSLMMSFTTPSNDFFNNMFPFLKVEDGRMKVDFKRQIKLKNSDDVYQVFLFDALKKTRNKPSDFARLKSQLSKLQKKDIHIFAENKKGIKEVINLLKEYGINYKEKEHAFRKSSEWNGKELKADFDVKINFDIARVLAKIAFNYFAYCCIQEGQSEILFESNFDEIRKFIYKGEGRKLKEIIPSISEERILGVERESDIRHLLHVITFKQEVDKIVAVVNFFALPTVYKIILGEIHPLLNRPDFGCAHAFDPASHEILNLSNRQITEPTEEQIRLSFGLFKR